MGHRERNVRKRHSTLRVIENSTTLNYLQMAGESDAESESDSEFESDRENDPELR